MMKRCLFLILVVVFCSTTTFAAEDYQYCEITGLAYGLDNKFIAALGLRILGKQGLEADETCDAIWQDAHDTGKRLALGATDKWSKEDWDKFSKLSQFEKKVLDSIIKNLELDL